MPAGPGSEVSGVAAGENYWMPIMSQFSLHTNELCLPQHYKIGLGALGWSCQANDGHPHCCLLPDFPLTPSPWQQSLGNGTLNRDTWVLIISHVESLWYFPSPHYMVPGYPLLSVSVCPHLGPWLVTARTGNLCSVPSSDPVSQPVGAHCDAILRIVNKKK